LLLAEAGPTEEWILNQTGTTGVHAMQLAVISPTHALIVDKVEHNPLTINGHPAWAALYNLKTHAVTALSMESNSFCAGGTFLRNGTMIIGGGNPVVENKTAPSDFGDVDGLQAIRSFTPVIRHRQVDATCTRIMLESGWLRLGGTPQSFDCPMVDGGLTTQR
jgi:hypothetical protein